MKGFKKCNNGHFFKENLSACPYCPSGNGGASAPAGGGGDMNKTMVGGAGGAEFTSTEVTSTDRTETFAGGAGSAGGGDKTQVFGGGSAAQNPAETHLVGNNKVSSPSSAPKRNLDRTFIGGIEEPATADGSESGTKSPNPVAPRATRKIVGWLISYTLDPMGIDWRIYEGTNLIGRDATNTIIISKDPTISSEHATILYRNGKYKIKDKMTANGTFINGEELEVEEAYDLNDGDELRLGNSVFRFKSAV
jgi:hypothetical protein